MIEVQSPIAIRTKIGTVHITVQHEDGTVIIETYQRNGKARYKFGGNHLYDGKLVEEEAH
jgi:hypothetical protein